MHIYTHLRLRVTAAAAAANFSQENVSCLFLRLWFLLLFLFSSVARLGAMCLKNHFQITTFSHKYNTCIYYYLLYTYHVRIAARVL